MTDCEREAALKHCPQFVPSCSFQSVMFRDVPWVLVHDHLSGQFVRIRASLWKALQKLDGRLSLAALLGHQKQRSGHDTDELLYAVMLLQRLGVLSQVESQSCPHQHDKPYVRTRLSSGTIKKRRFNPLMMRFALFNPQGLLGRVSQLIPGFGTLSYARWCFLLVIVAVLLAVSDSHRVIVQWHTFSESPQSLYCLLFYPLMRCFHELSHALVMRRYGADVPEAGISLLVFFPLPYVDATQVWTLSREQRLNVTAAGPLADLTCSAVALLVWWFAEPGAVSATAYGIAVMGLGSVVLFNANPLLKFDGYFLLEDWIGSPALARRSLLWYRYRCRRWLGGSAVRPPVVERGELRWLVFYAPLSVIYRCILAVIISVFLIRQWHEPGVFLALFCIFPLCVVPPWRFICYLFKHSELAGQRQRAMILVSLVLTALVVFVCYVPLPFSTRTQGVLWISEQAEVYAPQSGEIAALHVKNGDRVAAGDPIMTLFAPELAFELDRLQSRAQQLALSIARYRHRDPVQAASESLALVHQRKEIQHLQQQINRLQIHAKTAGHIVLSEAADATGFFVNQGQSIAHIVAPENLMVKVVLDEHRMGAVDDNVLSVMVRFAHNPAQRLRAHIMQKVPAATYDLPSPALADRGFGGFGVVRPVRDSSAVPGTEALKLKTREPVFHLSLRLQKLAEPIMGVPLGLRAYVTFKHPPAPVFSRLQTTFRQLLLRHLTV